MQASEPASLIQIPGTTQPAQSEASGAQKKKKKNPHFNTPISQGKKKKLINMRKEEKKPQNNTSLKNQNQAGKAPEGEKSTDPTKQQEPAMKKKAKGDPKTGQEEESHTCCGCRFPLLVALLQLVLGISITVLGFIMAGISSSLLVRDTPYWAGIIVCVVALVGMVMLCVSYQPEEKTCFQFAIKLVYFLLSTLSLITCVLAVAFVAHHYSQITQFTCDAVLDSCQCKLDTSDPLSRTFVYQDVSDCTSVTGTFNLYLLLQMVLNLITAIVCLLACFVMWKHRYQVFFVGVRLHSLTGTEIQQQKV
ncbi:sarcospan isoform X1 [Mauremys reevesii]|uniref:sarcospan isoform X1 n=2 Tax=Mauremys reevesii TaxID=260615 RepID=UPI00193ED1B4|nr:sarcospan isoform X1 [Mauremys reevesii]